MPLRRLGRWATGVLVPVLATALCSACSGAATSATATATGTKLTKLTMAVLTIEVDAPAWIAEEEGIFKRNGLDVTLIPVKQSTLAIPDLKKGTVQVVDGANYVSFFRAQEKGILPVRILTESQGCDPGTHEVIVAPNSKITSPSSLAGKTIAVNVNNDIQNLTLDNVLRAQGVNPASIHYTVVHFPDMSEALAKGDIDAAYEVEPFLTQAETKNGDRKILDACQGPENNMPLAGTAALTSWADSHRQAVQEVIKSMYEAQQMADQDHNLVQQVMIKDLHVSPVVAGNMNPGTWVTVTDDKQIQRTADQMFAAGMLKKRLDVKTIVFS